MASLAHPKLVSIESSATGSSIRWSRATLRLLLSLLILGSTVDVLRAQSGDTLVLTGTVVDEAGRPIVGADLGTNWNSVSGRMIPTPHVISDTVGAFRLEIRRPRRKFILMAMDDEQQRGALVVLDPADAEKPINLSLEPLINVRGEFFCEELGERPNLANARVSLLPDGIDVAAGRTRSGNFIFKLPPGEYRFKAYASDALPLNDDWNLSADRPVVEMGKVALAATPLARMYGKKPPPWKVTGARGVDADVQLDHFAGKWVLLDFWGYYWAPSIPRMASLMEFHDTHEEDHERFEIVAFHDARLKSFEEFDLKVSPIIAQRWNGKTPKFPLLLDATGETVKTYGVERLPTTVLIDPHGRVVRGGNLKMLGKALEGEEVTPVEPTTPTELPPATPKARDYVKTDRSRPLSGHTDMIKSVSFSPNGRYIATGCADVTLRIYDANTLESLHVLKRSNLIGDYPGPSIAFAPDGTTIAFANGRMDADRNLRRELLFWDVQTGKLKKRIDTEDFLTRSLAYSPDGQSLVTAGWQEDEKEHVIRIWGSKSNATELTLREHGGSTDSIAFSPDGVTLATVGGQDSTLRLWEFSSGRPIAVIDDFDGWGVVSVAYSPDGKTLACGSWHENLALRDARTGKPLRTLRWPGHNVYSVGFSPDGKYLATGGAWPDSTVHLWDRKANELKAMLVGHRGKVAGLAFSSDGTRLVSVSGGGAGTPGEALVWDLADLTP